jgi:hypothetical protein
MSVLNEYFDKIYYFPTLGYQIDSYSDIEKSYASYKC